MYIQIRKLVLGTAIAAVAAIPAFAGATGARADTGETVNVAVGQGESGYSVNAFLPQNLTIKTGTTVNYEFKWLEPHMVAMINDPSIDPNGPEPPVIPSPMVFDGTQKYIYSGTIFGPDQAYQVKFARAGTYELHCFIHPGMDSTVTVVDSGNADTNATITTRGNQEYATAIGSLKAIAAQQAAKGAAVTSRADGTKLYDLTMDSGKPGERDTVMQFFPATVTVKEGDSIRWTNNVAVPHTVTFNPPVMGPNDDPFSIPPSKPAAAFDGTGGWHSGILGANPDDPTAPTTFEMTFAKAGSYQYVCILHAPQGMAGTVNVEKQVQATPTGTTTSTPAATQTTAPRPPSTGSGVETASDGPISAWLVATALALAVAATGLGIFTIRRGSLG